MLTDAIKPMIAAQIRQMTGASRPLDDFLHPVGDPGLFGPKSVTWQVHAHFASMMVGGLSSLLIQAMHPGALAGVWDHSNFRDDLKARLGRTAYFIAATTYGGTAMAKHVINHVNLVHAKVAGIRPDGVHYSARDPHLLKWVHLAEILSFLKAYRLHGDPSLPLFAQNQYIFEMAQIGEALGATELPRRLDDAQRMLLAYEAELVFDDRAREVIALIEHFPARIQDQPLVKLVIQGAFQTLPQWVLEKMQRKPDPQWLQTLNQQALALISVPIDWTLASEGVTAYAKRRVSEIPR
jgi:uncharacterized protein (DUF2236 family)|uniref:oxygenase MpaB family protein n=1 Tax=Orrella sp. TaxID=1921583 RepID=UPI0040479382